MVSAMLMDFMHNMQHISRPFLHIKHSFSCHFLHNFHSKSWPGISNLPFLGSSSKFRWRRSNEWIIVHISGLSSRPCWEEVATSLKRDYQSLFSRRHLWRQKETCLGHISHKTFPHILLQACSEFKWIMFICEILSCELLTISATVMGLYITPGKE